MSRPIRGGGKSTPKPRGSKAKARAQNSDRGRPDAVDPDAVDFDSIDWPRVQSETVELDPALVERIRSQGKLQPLTLRVGAEQVAEARRIAAKTGTKYQAVLRRWLAEGASRARIERMKGGKGAA